MRDPDAWMAEAKCLDADPEVFFPNRGDGARDAQKICRLCPVRRECEGYALENDERFGVWGGRSENDRRKLRVLDQAS